MNDDDMTVTQAAALLDVTRPAVIQLIQRGVLPARRLGSFYVLQRADLLAYQANQAGKGKRGPRRRGAADTGEARAA